MRKIGAIGEQLAAFRAGTGPDFDLMLDVGFSQRPEGYMRIARALEGRRTVLARTRRSRSGLRWGTIRRLSRTPIASLEGLYGIGEYRTYLSDRTVDTAIVDPVGNGVWQAVRIATVADAFETHIAPHNPAGDLATLMSAHFCAAVPNVRIMELRPDEAPWTHEFLTHPPVLEDGHVRVPDRPGWGSDINEDALRAHPATGVRGLNTT